MNSGTVLIGSVGLTSITLGTRMNDATGARSRKTLKLSLSYSDVLMAFATLSWMSVYPCEFHHLGPLLGLVGDELAEILDRARQQRRALLGEARPQLGIGEARVDLLVEPRDDLGRRAFGREHAVPRARLVAGHE